MKKLNFSRILILVLSIALLIGSVTCITAMAQESDVKGGFREVSVSYGDKVYIRVNVNATEEEIKNGDVVVSYTLNGNQKTATYHSASANGVYVITEGIAAYDLAKEVVFSSTVGSEQVEEGRKYSVAQFLYKKLYTDNTVSAEYKNLYRSLLAYGEAAQIALDQDKDNLVTSSTLAYTSNSNVTINGAKFAFAPAADVEITPVWGVQLTAEEVLLGWKVIDDGESKDEGLTFTCSGVVEIVEPIIGVKDTTEYKLVNGDFENGLEGWTVVGNIGNVSSDKNYWVGDP
ncbi:MAG: hypothetical protein IJY18_03860 [Clostridia bacterium]|nr:hypothetical protein [Clostridia bacterium]